MSWEWDVLRLLAATLAGVLLSVSGSLLQLTTRNELATPSTLGMDGLAVLAVILGHAAALFLPFMPEDLSLLLGISFGVVVWGIAGKYRLNRAEDFRLVLLIGLGINLLVGSLFALMQFLTLAFNYDFPDQLWFGRVQTLSSAGWWSVLLLLVPWSWFAFKHRDAWLALLLGEGWCLGLGIPVDRILRGAMLLAYLATVWTVTQFGVFSFFGLLAPLLLRQLSRYRAQPAREISEGALVAGLLFALLDHACFNWTVSGAEIPVGLPFALFGAAALVALLIMKLRTVGKYGAPA